MDGKKIKRALRQSFLSLCIVTAAFVVSVLIQSAVKTVGLVSMVFILGAFLVAVVTDGYACGIAASLVSMLVVNWAFTYPEFRLDFSIADNLISAVCMLTVSVITSMQTTKLKRQKALEAENELERTRANLLRAVSHDLRTPLTSIDGACSAVLDNYDSLTKKQHLQLIGQAREDSQWLIRMVENLLTVTRMSVDENARIKKEPVVIEELADAAVTKFHRRHPEIPVEVAVPEEFLRVPMDAMLIEQVLLNLLENAAQHAHGMTRVRFRVRMQEDGAMFVVEDDGCGIRPEMMHRLFSDSIRKNDQPADDKKRGMGIGLSVCATIVRAHGGEISAENMPEGGALFRFTLPAGKESDEQ